MSKYDFLAAFYDFMETPLERKLNPYRRNMVGRLNGEVLEIGIGTGKNLPFYPKKVRVTGIDLSEGMLNVARRKNPRAKLIQMNVEKLEFPSHSFDAVVCSLVLCTVKNPLKALMEVKRVLKKGGKAILIEHVKSKHFRLQLVQCLSYPFTCAIFSCNPLRDTKNNIMKAGLHIVTDQNIYFKDVFRMFVCTR